MIIIITNPIVCRYVCIVLLPIDGVFPLSPLEIFLMPPSLVFVWLLLLDEGCEDDLMLLVADGVEDPSDDDDDG